MSRPTKIGGPGSPRPTYKNSRHELRQALRGNYEVVVPLSINLDQIVEILEGLDLTLGQVWIDDCMTIRGPGARITIPEAHRSRIDKALDESEQVGSNDG